MPPLEVGDWFLAHGQIHRPLYPDNVRVVHPGVGAHNPLREPMLPFYHLPLSAIEEIRKADGTIWRRST